MRPKTRRLYQLGLDFSSGIADLEVTRWANRPNLIITHPYNLLHTAFFIRQILLTWQSWYFRNNFMILSSQSLLIPFTVAKMKEGNSTPKILRGIHLQFNSKGSDFSCNLCRNLFAWIRKHSFFSSNSKLEKLRGRSNGTQPWHPHRQSKPR